MLSRILCVVFLWREPLTVPAMFGARIQEPVVQTRWPPLPEFNPVGDDPIPAPKGRSWRFLIGKASSEFGYALLQFRTMGYRLALG